MEVFQTPITQCQVFPAEAGFIEFLPYENDTRQHVIEKALIISNPNSCFMIQPPRAFISLCQFQTSGYHKRSLNMRMRFSEHR